MVTLKNNEIRYKCNQLIHCIYHPNILDSWIEFDENKVYIYFKLQKEDDVVNCPIIMEKNEVETEFYTCTMLETIVMGLREIILRLNHIFQDNLEVKGF